jgi:hypothetical protein
MDHPELSHVGKITREFLRACDMLLNISAGDAPLHDAELQLIRSYLQRLTVKFAA